MKYRVYQIPVSYSDSVLFNRFYQVEPDNIPKVVKPVIDKVNASRDVMFGKVKEENFPFYEHVANVEADDLEAVFRIGNFVYEDDADKILKLREMHSVSVGDIVVEESGKAHVVASFGFETVNFGKEM